MALIRDFHVLQRDEGAATEDTKQRFLCFFKGRRRRLLTIPIRGSNGS